jgi:hypothetical protein
MRSYACTMPPRQTRRAPSRPISPPLRRVSASIGCAINARAAKLISASNVLLWRRDHKGALAEFARMIALDPNFAQGHTATGLALMYAGERARALIDT